MNRLATLAGSLVAALTLAGLAVILILVRDVQDHVTSHQQGLQSITHDVLTPAGPASITTKRAPGQSINAWLQAQTEALKAAMGD